MKMKTVRIRSFSVHCSVPLTGCGVFLASLVGVGCSAVPKPDVDVSRGISDAAGLAEPVRFVAVGPDGGPLDEPDAAGRVLSLPDALRRAVTTDPGLQAAMARVRIAQADADQARLLPNPVLSVVLRWGPGKPQIEASLAQEFVQALQIPRRASAADNRLRHTAADAVTVAIDVASEVQERYASAQASAALVPVLRERKAILEKVAAIAKARLDAGEGTRHDLTALNAQGVELQVEIDQAILAEREERLRLARLIGEPSSSADWTLDPWAEPVAEQQPESAWVNAALQHRPEIQSIVWKLRSLSDEEAAARLLPWEGADVGVEAQHDDKWFVGPAVSTPLPIFDDGQARRDRATAEQLEARHELTLARRKVVEEVRVAYQTMAAGRANLARIRNELVPLREQQRLLAEQAYRAGQTDATELFLADQDLRQTLASAIEVERQVLIASIRLRRAVGGPGVAATILSDTSTTPTRTRQH